jgi:hypothetical protein
MSQAAEQQQCISARLHQFRVQYQSDIHPLYNGILHIGVIYAVGVTAIAWCISRMQNPSWEWLLVFPIFFISNLFEWWIHKRVMHRLINVWAFRAIYDRHTRQHHQYFTDTEMTVNSTREWRIIFFPWRALFSFIALGTPFALLLGVFVNPNAGYVLIITIVAQYLIYETFHFCCHVRDNWFVRNTPFINTIRRHHKAHHNLGLMMSRNMNLTFPIADWLMGTSDLDRGIVGHLLNGYNEDYIRTELKPVIARFRRLDEAVAVDGTIEERPT